MVQISLQNLSDEGTFTPVGAQGLFHGTPPKKSVKLLCVPERSYQNFQAILLKK